MIKYFSSKVMEKFDKIPTKFEKSSKNIQ